jgi:PAS domain S-box-containing protein
MIKKLFKSDTCTPHELYNKIKENKSSIIRETKNYFKKLVGRNSYLLAKELPKLSVSALQKIVKNNWGSFDNLNKYIVERMRSDKNLGPKIIEKYFLGLRDIISVYLQKEFEDQYHKFITANILVDDQIRRMLLEIIESYYELTCEMIKKSEENYRLLFESADEGIIMINIDGEVLNVNHKFLSITGLKMEEVVGKNITDISLSLKIDQKQLENNFRKFISGNIIKETHWVIVNKKGKKIKILVHGALIKKKGEIIGATVMITK